MKLGCLRACVPGGVPRVIRCHNLLAFCSPKCRSLQGGLCSVLPTCVSAGHILLFKEILQALGYCNEGHDTDAWASSIPHHSQVTLDSLGLYGWATYSSAVAAVKRRPHQQAAGVKLSIHPSPRHCAQALRGRFGLIFDVYFSEVDKAHI